MATNNLKFCPKCGFQFKKDGKFCPECGQNLSLFNKPSQAKDEDSFGFSLALKSAATYTPLIQKSPLSFLSYGSGNPEKKDFTEDDFYLLSSILINYLEFYEELEKRYPEDTAVIELGNEIAAHFPKFRQATEVFVETGILPESIPDFLIKNQAYAGNLIGLLENDHPSAHKGMILMLGNAVYCMAAVATGNYDSQAFRKQIGFKEAGTSNADIEDNEATTQSRTQSRTQLNKLSEKEIIYVAPDFEKEITELERSLGEHNVPLKISYYNPEIDYWKELDNLIGLEGVKSALRTAINDFKLQQKRKAHHPDLQITTSLNSIFSGSPGTGKTTVARLVAGILRQEGIIKGGMCVEADASNLVSSYVGMSAQLTKLAALKALDGILFIDEAYAIANNFKMSKGAGPGKDVIDALTPIMENNRGRLNVILAGYEKEMTDFLKESNTGFPSRFKLNIKFEDYTPEEMMVIFNKIMNANKYIADTQDLLPVKMIFDLIYKQRRNIPAFANARTVRSIFEKIKERASNRMLSNPEADLDRFTIEDMALSNAEIKQALGLF